MYPIKSKTINSFRDRKKIIFIDDDEKNILDVRKNVPGAYAIKAEPGKSSANMVALAVATLRDPQSLSYEGHMPGEVHMDGGRKHTKSKSKSKRKTKSKRKSKRKTMKK
jgi:hypothetical protein